MNKLRQCELRQTYVVPTMNTDPGSVRQTQGNQNQNSGRGGGGRGRVGGRTGNAGKGDRDQGNNNSNNQSNQGKDLSHIECYLCHKKGYYKNKCPEKPSNKVK